MQKTVYICDRCGKESEDLQGWNSLRYEGDDEGWVPTLLCPTCSSRALEKPDTDFWWDYQCVSCGCYTSTPHRFRCCDKPEWVELASRR